MVFKFDPSAWWHLLVRAGTWKSLLVLDVACLRLLWPPKMLRAGHYMYCHYCINPSSELLLRKQRKPSYQLQSQPCGSGTSDTCTESRIQLVRIEICTHIHITRCEHFDFPLSGRGIIVTVSVSIVDDHEPSILVIWQIRKKIGQCGNETKNQICSILFSIYSCTDWPQYPILVTHIHKASAICDKHMA